MVHELEAFNTCPAVALPFPPCGFDDELLLAWLLAALLFTVFVLLGPVVGGCFALFLPLSSCDLDRERLLLLGGLGALQDASCQESSSVGWFSTSRWRAMLSFFFSCALYLVMISTILCSASGKFGSFSFW